ncbi:MAG: cobalamin-dependent protein [Thermoguttaceae bacterium]
MSGADHRDETRPEQSPAEQASRRDVRIDRPHEFLANLLYKANRSLAGYAATDLLGTTPDAAASFPPDPFQAWQDLLAGRLEELAAAVVAERPQLFVRQVQWSKTVHSARGVSSEHLRAGLRALRHTLSNELPEAYRPIGAAYLDQALAEFDREPSDIAPLTPYTPDGHLASEYLLAILEGDRRHASRVIFDAIQDGQTVPNLYLNVLTPVQVEVGRMWLANEITVAEEHFASTTTKMMVAQLRPYAQFPPCHGKILVAAAVDGNLHDLGVQIVTNFFEMDGWRVIYLGASMPIEDLVLAVNFYKADLLALSVALTTQLPTLHATIEAVRQSELGSTVKVLAGGGALAGWGDLAQQFGADAYAADAVEAVAVGNRLSGR